LVVTLVDLVKFFDKEEVYDELATMQKEGIDPKCIRIWEKLNRRCNIKVKTGVRVTECFDVGLTIGQGGAGAVLISQINIDDAINEYFKGSDEEEFYGCVRMQSMSFQDDIQFHNSIWRSVVVNGIKMNYVLNEKGQECHPKKSGFIVFVTKKYKELITKEEEDDPLWLGWN